MPCGQQEARREQRRRVGQRREALAEGMSHRVGPQLVAARVRASATKAPLNCRASTCVTLRRSSAAPPAAAFRLHIAIAPQAAAIAGPARAGAGLTWRTPGPPRDTARDAPPRGHGCRSVRSSTSAGTARVTCRRRSRCSPSPRTRAEAGAAVQEVDRITRDLAEDLAHACRSARPDGARTTDRPARRPAIKPPESPRRDAPCQRVSQLRRPAARAADDRPGTRRGRTRRRLGRRGPRPPARGRRSHR